MEYQVVYDIKSSLPQLQHWLNHMARDGWTLAYINANTRYLVFQRVTSEPHDHEVIYVNVPNQLDYPPS